MSDLEFIVLAYGVAWAGISIYRVYLGARRRAAERLAKKEGV